MIYIGRIVNTHGIKGEVRIKSDISHKDLVFKNGNHFIVDGEELEINSYRVHKDFDMVTFKNINDINDVLKYKSKNVYINKNEINEDILFEEEYIGLSVYTDHFVGTVEDILKNKIYDILVVKNDKKEYLVPNIDEFIKQIDIDNKKIYINEIDGLINENWCSNSISRNVWKYY